MNKPRWYYRLLLGQRALGFTWDFHHARIGLKQALNPTYWYSDSRLLEFKDKHLGQTCVIVGNGPSLNHTNTKLLAGQYTFGMNRIYIATEKLGFNPTFYVCINQLVLEQCWSDILQLKIPKFLSSRHGVHSHKVTDAIFLKTMHKVPQSVYFSTDPTVSLWEGYTVTYVALQLAFWMGFKKVLLVGVDHNFTTKGEPNKEIVSDGPDPNHFSGDYFHKGFRWHLPDLENSELAYRLADYTYRGYGREIIDCTVGGKCTIFKKSTLEAELADHQPPSPAHAAK